MKKIVFLPILLALAALSFADDLPNRRIFIEGTASRGDISAFFLTNFRTEARGTGYTIVENKTDAAFTFKFNVSDNTPNDGNRYVLKISLIKNEDNFEVLSFDFFFSDLDEMYEHNRSLFLRAVSYIPPLTEDDVAAGHDGRWKNKWIYLRASFDYPITFYALLPEGLTGDNALHNAANTAFDPLDHSIMAMPGATLGIEFQFLDFMSIEVNCQASMGDTRNNSFVNIAAGAELKFPIKFENIILIPYGTFLYNLTISKNVFDVFPQYEYGGGIQLCARGGNHGAFFVDIKYIFSLSDTIMRNPWLAFDPAEQYAPIPEQIHYKRFVIGIGIGYKFGFFDRK